VNDACGPLRKENATQVTISGEHDDTTVPVLAKGKTPRPGSSYAFFGGQFEKIGGGRRASTLLYDHDLTSVLANQYGSNYNQTLDDQLGVLIYTKKIKPVV
jgi:hypothetical protein